MISISRFARVTLVLALLAVPACRGFARHQDVQAITTILPTSYKADVSLPPIAKLDDYKKRLKGLLHVQLLDNLNRKLAGAFIRYKGPDEGQVVTNANGVMEVLVAPGSYKVDVAPCGTTVVTKDYQSALASVVAGGRPSQGTLSGIRWQRRFHPVPAVTYSDDPPWKIGDGVRASIRVEDRCPTSYGAAARAPLTTFRWKTSANFGFTKAPVMRADAQGNINISFLCRARGDGAITIYDPVAPEEDPINILEAGAGPGSGHKFCEK